jgi:asparagine synthase (glutamine-hydrolysing)
MCGIAGYIGRHEIANDAIARTLGLMSRRGPDHAGHRHFLTRAGAHVHLLHSRLKIVDLDSRANQPFSIGKRTIVYNGELYNFIEQKARLEACGKSFITTSDTEVLLTTLEEGVTALDRCEGMWAFALYDEGDETLLLSRDRFGEKPLYLFRTDAGLYFGSEIKFIKQLAGCRLEIDVDHLRRYLVNGYKTLYKRPQNFFKGVNELPAASWMRLAPSNVDGGVYWTPQCNPNDSMSYEQAVAGTRERLIRAVEIRLRADVPLAFCMSGGIDSNALISIAKKELGYDVHGFTIANSDERYEEADLVSHAVRELGIKHTSIPTDTTNFLQNLRTLVRQHDAPVFTITYYAHWLLMQSIAQHGYRISVSGTAADELFTGYYDHHLAYLYEVRADPELSARARQAWAEHIKPIVRNPFLSNPDLFIRDPAFRDHIFLDAEGFAGYLTTPWSEPFEEARYTESLLRNRMMNELFHESVPVILHEDDLNAMYFSIENRSPFLDRHLFEFAFNIPSRHLIRQAYGKAVLRDSMRGIAPDAILDNRRKVGFNAPIFSFLDLKDPRCRDALLERSPVFDIVRRDKIAELLDKEFLPNSQSKFLFYFLCAKLFLEELAE